MDRGKREFLKMVLAAGVSLWWGRGRRAAAYPVQTMEEIPEPERFFWAQIRYRGGDWDPDPGAAQSLCREVIKRTSVMASLKRVDLPILSPDLFNYPMIYLTGHYEFDPFSEEEISRLRRYLDYGGLLVADDCAGHPGFDFDKAFNREVERLYPGRSLARLPRDHAVLRSFYFLRTVGGRRLISPYLEGLDVGERTAILYCRNDFGCALERDAAGGWVHPCLPGGERQRLQAFQLAVNIVLYGLCQDYKSDKIHELFLRQRS